MLLCRVELCVTGMSASRQILMIYIKTIASVAPCEVSRLGGPRDFVSRVGILDNPSFQILCPQVLES